MSKFEVFKCDWCNGETRKQVNNPQPPRPNSKVVSSIYTEREGLFPVMDVETKVFHPMTARLHFCGNSCNQSYKQMEEEAKKAADEAWITVYNRRKDA